MQSFTSNKSTIPTELEEEDDSKLHIPYPVPMTHIHTHEDLMDNTVSLIVANFFYNILIFIRTHLYIMLRKMNMTILVMNILAYLPYQVRMNITITVKTLSVIFRKCLQTFVQSIMPRRKHHMHQPRIKNHVHQSPVLSKQK